MQVLPECVVEIKPSSYVLVLGGGTGGKTDMMDLRVKVTRSNIRRFTDILPLLLPVARSEFKHFTFSIETAVDIDLMLIDTDGNYSKSADLSAKVLQIKVDGDLMTFSVKGIEYANTLPVAAYVEQISTMFKLFGSSDITNLRPGVGTARHNAETFRVLGIENTGGYYAPFTLATFRNGFCIVGAYQFTPASKIHQRVQHGIPLKYLIRGKDGVWVQHHTAPFNGSKLVADTNEFTVF